jgi:hypothetical protein
MGICKHQRWVRNTRKATFSHKDKNACKSCDPARTERLFPDQFCQTSRFTFTDSPDFSSLLKTFYDSTHFLAAFMYAIASLTTTVSRYYNPSQSGVLTLSIHLHFHSKMNLVEPMPLVTVFTVVLCTVAKPPPADILQVWCRQTRRPWSGRWSLSPWWIWDSWRYSSCLITMHVLLFWSANSDLIVSGQPFPNCRLWRVLLSMW